MMSKEKWNVFWGKHKFPVLTKIGFGIEKKAIKKILYRINIEKSAKIIDFGCGEGRTLSYLRDIGFKNSVGIDNSKEAINRCITEGFKINKDVFLVPNRKVYTKKYDLLFSQGLLEHYKKEDWPEIIRRMTSLSKKYIILMQPLTTSLMFKTISFFIKHFSSFWDYIDEYDYDVEDFIVSFKKYGFIPKILQTTHKLPKKIDTSIFIILEKI